MRPLALAILLSAYVMVMACSWAIGLIRSGDRVESCPLNWSDHDRRELCP